jgi:hypothetical protein
MATTYDSVISDLKREMLSIIVLDKTVTKDTLTKIDEAFKIAQSNAKDVPQPYPATAPPAPPAQQKMPHAR